MKTIALTLAFFTFSLAKYNWGPCDKPALQ